MFDKFKSFLKEIKLLSVEKKQRLMNLVLRLSNLVLVKLALWKKKILQVYIGYNCYQNSR